MGDLIMKQARAIVDERTTVICLDVHGVIMPVGEPFETLAGDFQSPPFHVHCRTLVGPYMKGFVQEARKAANAELMKRPKKQRRKGPDGPAADIPGPVTGNPPSGFSRRDADREFAAEDAKSRGMGAFKPEVNAPQTGTERLAYQFKAGYAGTDDHIWQGNRAEVEIGTLADGTKVVRKTVTSEEEADKEYLSSLIANALGVEMFTAKVGPQELVMDYVEGQTGNGWLNDHSRDVEFDWSIKSDQKRRDAQSDAVHLIMTTMDGGREIGLLDWLIHNPDRHAGNWLIRDGRVYPIDHGNSLFADSSYEDDKGKTQTQFNGSPFALHWLGAKVSKFMELKSLNPSPHWTRAELGEIREKLAGLESEFSAHPDWFAYVMKQLDDLTVKVKA